MCLFFVFTLSVNIAHMHHAAAILKGFFFPNIWEICVSGVFSVDSLIERKSDAGPLSRSIYQSVWKNFK